MLQRKSQQFIGIQEPADGVKTNHALCLKLF